MEQPAELDFDIARIECALTQVAGLLVIDDIYLPIFLRLERELEDARAKRSAIDRTRRIIDGDGPSMTA